MKSTKSTKTQPSKGTKRCKRLKIKNALQKHLKGKKSLIRLFAFLCFCVREEKKKENREKSPNVKYRCSMLVCKISLGSLSMQL